MVLHLWEEHQVELSQASKPVDEDLLNFTSRNGDATMLCGRSEEEDAVITLPMLQQQGDLCSY